MNLFSELKNNIYKIIEDQFGEVKAAKNLVVEFPKSREQGHFATNAAMVIKGEVGGNPRELAEKIVVEINKLPQVKEARIAGPGFINMDMKPSFFQRIIPHILDSQNAYGDSNIGGDKKVNIEFLSANPTGPLHVGHSRIAIHGDALCRVMRKAGFDVTREYYINDAGAQMDVLAQSTFIRYKNELGEDLQIPEGMYPGEYLIDIAKTLVKKFGDSLLKESEEGALNKIKEAAVNEIMDIIRADLKEVDIKFDVFTSEKKDLHDKNLISEGIEYLKEKGLVYTGVLEKPKGKLMDDWEPREQLLFKSSDYGDDVDRPLVKSDDSYTYFAADIGYHINKFERGFKDMILILGADHGGYVKRMKAMVKAISNDEAAIDVKLNQLVNLFKNGEPFKMSKRAGNFITIKDVVDEVGKDILRFVMLSRKSDTVLDFDFDKVREQSNENPVFYVQYVSARTNSILSKAAEQGIEYTAADLSNLESEEDINLVMKLAEFPRIVESAAVSHEPHRISFYLQELAQEFHSYWGKGNSDESKRIIMSDAELSKARVSLAKAVNCVITAGLNTLGVQAVDRM